MAVIHIFRFSPVRGSFDDVLRAVVPGDLGARPDSLDWYCGRRGPGDLGPRTIVSVWASREAMAAVVGDRLGVFHPEHFDDVADPVLEIHDVLLAVRLGSEAPGILRVFRGRVRPGELRAYVDDVHRGVELDAELDHAPTALFLADAGGDAFVTVSAWRDWTAIEGATGGNVHRPAATRQPSRLVAWEVDHWEIVPGCHP